MQKSPPSSAAEPAAFRGMVSVYYKDCGIHKNKNISTEKFYFTVNGHKLQQGSSLVDEDMVCGKEGTHYLAISEIQEYSFL